MAEIAFEYLLAGIEAARGTPLADPTRYLNLAGTVTPRKERYRPDESRGVLAEFQRSVDVRRFSEFDAEGGLDVYTLPTILNTIVRGAVPGPGTAAASVELLGPVGADNMVEWEAVTSGSAGNLISVEYRNPLANSSPLDLDLSGGNYIIVHLATDVGGAITTVANEIIAAVAAHPTISLLVTAANVAPDDGTAVVTAVARTFLAGGESDYVTTPGGAVNARLWTFEPTMDADDLESMTIYWGDPNVQAFQAAFCMVDDLTVTADAAGTDGVTLSISGQGRFPAQQAPGVVPAMLTAPLLMPANMQLWVNTTHATIGSTAVTGRVVSAEVSLPSGLSRKWLAAGPTAGLDFQDVGRGKRHMEMSVVFEVPDMVQYDQWVAQTELAVRLRINGAIIDAAPDFYNYVEFDIYGPFDGFDWGENEGTNRTLELMIISEYNEDAGFDWAVKVQSNRDTL